MLTMQDDKKDSTVIDDFLVTIKRFIRNPEYVGLAKGIENYYHTFLELYKNFTDVHEKLSQLEYLFKNIDQKSNDEKLMMLKKVCATFEGLFLDISEEELKEMEFFLARPIRTFKSVGEKIAQTLENKGIINVKDALFMLPYKYIDKRRLINIKDLTIGEQAYFKGKIIDIQNWSAKGFLEKRGKGLLAIVSDGTGTVMLKWFQQPPPFIKSLLVKGNELLIFGNVQIFKGQKKIHHPEIEKNDSLLDSQRTTNFKVIPLYFGLPTGINHKFYCKLIFQILQEGKNILKTLIPLHLKNELNLLSWWEALFNVHFPQEDFSVNLYESFRSPYHLTLIYQELFLLFSIMLQRKLELHKINITPLSFTGDLARNIVKKLGYNLTNAQKRVIREIRDDLLRPYPMQRLLQGDVGSGKTIVALLSALFVVESGKQVAIMAPTEILAKQHYINFKNLLIDSHLSICLIKSDLKKRDKELIVNDIKNGKYQLIVGTHALIQESVEFKNLGFVIIDEQHRFGVEQRSLLVKKGKDIPHALYMTATPIPRTLAMTIHGDLDLSIIDEFPPGRKEIKTHIWPELHRERAFSLIEEELKKGRQAYIVYPVIDEDNALELKAATNMYELICKRFPTYEVCLIHGRLKAQEKEDIMREFKDGKKSIMVSTTVVEVGVDVPNATVMVIEHGERFGLAQLHQLRGRIGRGSEASTCIILVDTKRLSEKARERLIFFRDHTDGFKLAEYDLSMRGPGELLGPKQAGLPELFIVNIVRDAEYIEFMKNRCEKLINKENAYFWETILPKLVNIYFGRNAEYLKAG